MSFLETIPLVLSVFVGIFSLLIRLLSLRREKKETEEKTSQKFEELSSILKTASTKIKEMEREIEDKRRKVEELTELKKELDALSSLREEQVAVIRGELNSIIEKSAWKNRIWTIVIGAIWFIIGLVVRGFVGV